MNKPIRLPFLLAGILALALIAARGFYVDLTHPAPISTGTYAAAGVSTR